MKRTNISLSKLFWAAALAIFVFIAVYERRRANEIEARSIVLSSPEYRAVLEQDWNVMQRELQLRFAKQDLQSSQVSDFEMANLTSVSVRRDMANIRNAELKLTREKLKLAAMRDQVIRQTVDSQSK